MNVIDAITFGIVEKNHPRTVTIKNAIPPTGTRNE